jgi:hypothetical protein
MKVPTGRVVRDAVFHVIPIPFSTMVYLYASQILKDKGLVSSHGKNSERHNGREEGGSNSSKSM